MVPWECEHEASAWQLCFVSKGQRGTLMMCLLCVSAAICLKLPHYVEDQIKCTPGPRALPLDTAYAKSRPTSAVTSDLTRAARHLLLNVCQLSHDMLLIRLKPFLSGCPNSLLGSQTGEAAGSIGAQRAILWQFSENITSRQTLTYCHDDPIPTSFLNNSHITTDVTKHRTISVLEN